MKKALHVIVSLLVVALLVIVLNNVKFGQSGDPITLGAEWFLNNQDENFIHYEYDYVQKEHSDSHHSLREMGSLWSITQAAKFTGDKKLKALGERGFEYFEQSFKYDEGNDFLFVNVTPQKVKLGYNAFAILALLDLEHPKKDEYLEDLAKGILFHQKESGELRTFFYSIRATGKDYYPGEALLALMSLYEYNGKQEYLNAVVKAFPHYRDYYRDNPNTAFIPWQSRAYRKLYKATGDPEVADFLFEMNDFMLLQNEPAKECSDFGFPRGITVAVFLEGVIHAYDVARDVGDAEREACYLQFIDEAVDHIISLQKINTPEIHGVGGFVGSKNSTTMRVDRNQHAIMALMDAYNLTNVYP